MRNGAHVETKHCSERSGAEFVWTEGGDPTGSACSSVAVACSQIARGLTVHQHCFYLRTLSLREAKSCRLRSTILSSHARDPAYISIKASCVVCFYYRLACLASADNHILTL